MLFTVLGLIGATLLYYYHSSFLPKPVGEVVVLTPPPRLQLPMRAGGLENIYERPDFAALRTHTGIPVKAPEPHGEGSPFQKRETAE